MAATPVMLPGARKHQLVLQEQYDAMRPLLSLTATCPELGDPLVARVATFLRDLGPSGNYPIKELWLDIVGGQSTYAKYASDPSQVNALYNSKQSIAEFAWFILALACLKGQPLVRGAVCFEDPEYRIFKAFARHGYSRVLGVAAALKTAEKNSFGSTHLLPFIQHSRGRGTWFTPEETHLFALSDATARGYTQVGIDIEYGKDAGVRLGLLAGCSHVLLGKIPLKGIGQTRQFTFFKIEQHGTKQAAQFVMHGFDLLHSIQAKKSKAKPKAGSGAEGETGPEFYHRRERVDKTLLASFVELVRAALNCQTTVPLWRSDLTVDEFAHRAKHVGLSLMFATANEIQIAATAMVRALRGAAGIAAKRSSENAAVLLAKTDAWLKSVARDPALDHVRCVKRSEPVFFVCLFVCFVLGQTKRNETNERVARRRVLYVRPHPLTTLRPVPPPPQLPLRTRSHPAQRRVQDRPHRDAAPRAARARGTEALRHFAGPSDLFFCFFISFVCSYCFVCAASLRSSPARRSRRAASSAARSLRRRARAKESRATRAAAPMRTLSSSRRSAATRASNSSKALPAVEAETAAAYRAAAAPWRRTTSMRSSLAS
jgi:hypothetical protein